MNFCSNSRFVELSWAGRVRTGNRQSIDCVKDNEVVCRFKEVLSRENIYKEIAKTKWLFTRIAGLVLRPGGLVDFTLRSKDMALSFAKALNDLDSVRSATAHADTVVEVRIDFIPPGFPRPHHSIFGTKSRRIIRNPHPYLRPIQYTNRNQSIQIGTQKTRRKPNP